MIYQRYLHFLILLLLFSLLLSLTTCEKFSGDQTIPAYLKINTIALTTDKPSIVGSVSQNITDAWVYVDDELIGAFQLPAKFPVLEQGNHFVQIFAGIKKNGIATTRTSYPFYAPIKLDLTFTPDSVITIDKAPTTYESSTMFLLIEDFEGPGMALDTTPRSLVGVAKTDPGSAKTFEGNHSAIIELTKDKNHLEWVSHSSYTIPSAPVYLEMNFNTNNNLTVGVVVYMYQSLVQQSVFTALPTNGQWKKIYIDLTTSLNNYSGATAFKVYYIADLDSDSDSGEILLDNIKVVTK